ncbi:DUF4303 domain-containing protein [Flammeovirga sp. OC4]|uniref:DUF4303 domain-containing protein n=1 Tax=Flammeovirga sp. OC4 TaxID=1382345 RepID=UPI0005C75B4D|nr:DUF4303 domain-containing protein [Flammeovirga sp. OC4]
MTIKQLSEELQQLLYDALQRYLKLQLQQLSDEKIYAVAVYCDSGCRSMGGAVSTLESLSQQVGHLPADSDITTFELYASEWKYVNEHYAVFDQVDECIDNIYDVFYEGELDDVDLEELEEDQLWNLILSFFSEVIINTLSQLKKEKVFQNDAFTEDVFLGVQFGDIGEEDQKMLLEVSSQLNSDYWHNKLLESLKAYPE